ncbi:hypothetical protein ABG067_002944 [Albugo candida]|uniref:RING-type domain-containing protein n=1 Tax=Albugo candida TaxID=65357 RepID=A0A024G1S9_9STRA|nr:unnamed protein product [Albugo candida]|eukprot:CCI40615.1 unnamed protein product [Albugo candida]
MDPMVPRCCVCGTSAEDDSNYLNIKMKMLISKCGHRFCDQCIKREFQHHREIACPTCSKPVKKSQLQDKTIEEINYTKEVSIRKKVLKDYNKTEDDFVTLEEYNDYLETLENLIFDLVYGDDEEKGRAQKQWKMYRQENLAVIATNDAKKAEEERRISHLLTEQQRIAEERRLLQQKEDSQFEADVERQRAELMEVALGERDENQLTQLRATTTAIPIDQPTVVTAEMEAAMMGIHSAMHDAGPQPVPVPGGKRKSHFGVHESKKMRKDQQRAGGYILDLHYKRNREEAWTGIMFPFGVQEKVA